MFLILVSAIVVYVDFIYFIIRRTKYSLPARAIRDVGMLLF